MKTEVIMKRKLEGTYKNVDTTTFVVGMKIRQRHKTGFFSLKDLENLGNEYRKSKGLPYVATASYFRTQGSKEFIKELENKYGEVQVGGLGRGHEKWVHPYLFMDIAMWYNPSLKVLIYTWMTDNLLLLRDISGDSYKGMVKAIAMNLNLASRLPKIMPDICKKIQEAVGVSSQKGKWEEATKEQLMLRDNIHTRIEALTYALKNIDQIVDIAIKSALEHRINVGTRKRTIKKIIKNKAV